jgi:hypothetical protein
MNGGGLLALPALALFSVVLALQAGRPDSPRWPSGWRNPEAIRSPAAARFIRVYGCGLAALLLVDFAVIGRLPWKVAAGVIVSGGLVALAAAGWGVRRYTKDAGQDAAPHKRPKTERLPGD